VVLKEVPLHADVFGLLAGQGILGVRDGALVVLPHGGCSGDGSVENLPRKLAEVESLLGGVCRREVFNIASEMGDASMLIGLVDDMTAVECKTSSPNVTCACSCHWPNPHLRSM
jgi:hypothetical protein